MPGGSGTPGPPKGSTRPIGQTGRVRLHLGGAHAEDGGMTMSVVSKYPTGSSSPATCIACAMIEPSSASR